MRGTRLLVVTLWMATGCRVVGNATPDGGTSVTIPQVEITNIALESPRPDSVGLNEDGGTVLEVYSGDIIQVEGRNWEVRDVTVTVGGVPLPVLEGSTNTLLRVKIPVAMPTGSVRVETTNSRGDSANSVVLLGPGHLEGLAERGLVQGQGIIHASGALLGCDFAPPTQTDAMNRPLNAVCNPIFSAVHGMAVAFTPGLRANAQDGMYWTALSLDDQNGDWFGPVPVPDTLGGFPLAGQELLDLRSYALEVDAGPGETPRLAHIPVALQLLYAIPPVGAPVVEARVVTPLAASPPLDSVVGPLFVNQVDNGLLDEMPPSLPPRILSLRATPTSVTVLEHRVLPDGTMGVEPLDTSGQGGELPQRVAAAGQFDLNQLGRSVITSSDPPEIAPPNMPGFMLLTCPLDGDPSFRMELHPFALLDLTGNNGPAWTPLPAFPVTGCGLQLCAGVLLDQAQGVDGGVAPMPAQVPGLIPWGVGTILVQPPGARGTFDQNAATPCAIFMDLDGGPPPDASADADAGTVPDADGGSGEVPIDPVDPRPEICVVDGGGPCGTGRELWGLFGSGLAISRELGGGTQYLHALADTRRILTTPELTPANPGENVDQVVSVTPYTNLIADPWTGFLIGVPLWGASVDVLSVASASAEPLLRIPLAGAIRGGWPLHGPGGGILVLQQHMGMVLDVGGNPTAVMPQPGRPMDGITRMEGAGDANIFVVSGSTPLGPALFTWDADAESPMLTTLLQEDNSYSSLLPVAARDGRVLYWRLAAQRGDTPPAGMPGSPPVGGCFSQLVTWSMDTAVATVVPTLCNEQPSQALLDRDQNVWLPTRNAAYQDVLRVFRPGVEPLDASGIGLQTMALLPTGAVLAVVYTEGPPGRLALACLTLEEGAVRVVDVGPPPTLDGPILTSPDARRVFAGTSNGLLELEVPELEGNGCPPAATPQRPVPLPVTRRITLPGTPTSLSINRAGNRLIWLDQAAQLVGLVE